MQMEKSRSVWINVAVGVAILMVLLAVLFPVRAGDSHHTPAYRCMTNLKQLALAQLAYADDHDGRLPDAGMWMDLTVRNASREQLLHCPVVVKENPTAYGYAMNIVLSSDSLSGVDKPDRVPLLFDSALLGRNAACDINGQADPPRHGTRNCVAFADGSVKRVAPGSNRK